MTMSEDFWLPRREGGKGTEIDTLAGGQSLGEIDDIVYFQRKLYKALNVPISRLDSESQFTMGRASEVTRDEIKFTKFVRRLRNRFSMMLSQALEKQLILKGIITSADWAMMKNQVQFIFADDSHFAELKEAEIRRGRLEDAGIAEEFVGVYISRQHIYKNILMFTEDDIAAEKIQMDKEEAAGELSDPEDKEDEEIGSKPVQDPNGDGRPDQNSPTTEEVLTTKKTISD